MPGAGFLAGYRGLTREAYALDLRQFTTWCRARSLGLFAVRRADIESFARDLEAKGRARATLTRRLCTIAGFYKYAVEEELLEHWRVRSWSSGRPCSGASARFRIRARSQGVSCAEWRAGPADTASGPAAWVAPGRITRERTCRCQRLLAGRRAHLMEPGGMMTRGLGDVGSGCRSHRTTGSNLGWAAPNGDPESGSSSGSPLRTGWR
jgi:hypothetical protein